MGGKIPAPAAPVGRVTENHRAAVLTGRAAHLLTLPAGPCAPEHPSREDFVTNERYSKYEGIK